MVKHDPQSTAAAAADYHRGAEDAARAAAADGQAGGQDLSQGDHQ